MAQFSSSTFLLQPLATLLGEVETFDELEHKSMSCYLLIYLLGIIRNSERNIHCTQTPEVRKTTFMISVEIIHRTVLILQPKPIYFCHYPVFLASYVTPWPYLFLCRSVKQHLKILKISTPWTGSPCVGLVLESRNEE